MTAQAKLALLVAATIAALGVALPAASAAKKGASVHVLSSRADLVSGGNALVAIDVPRKARGLRVFADRRDVTKSFRPVSRRRVEGLITGLKLGRTTLTARLRERRGARLKITNHPAGGPVFSGPQIQPWECQDGAVDAKCNQRPSYSYLYKPIGSTALAPYDPDDPPSDVDTTTTDEGVTVPFVVRRETGYLNRDQYKIFALFDPAAPWSAAAPQPQFNRKLFIPHGGNCGSAHGAGEAPTADYSGTFPDNPGMTNSYVTALGRGFAVMSTALANLGHNCNVATAAEALMMAKERVIERYGAVRYTIGSGCSGGSITQQTVANAYPRAVYDGLVITCAYPDALTALTQFEDYNLLRSYFEDPEHLVGWTPVQWAAVEGRPDPVNAIVAVEAFGSIPDPTTGCVPADQVYDPETRPEGVRCGLFDYLINQLGPRPEDVWSDNERKLGRGFAGIPFGNVGVQYGLATLEQGLITPEQFTDLNASIGGFDVDVRPVPERLAGDDRAVANAYRSGLVNEANNLSGVAIIHHAGPDPGAAHDYAHSQWIIDRLVRAQGHRDNHVLWYGPAPLIGDPGWANEALLEMDRWLTAVEADDSRGPRARKIIDNRPAGLVDRCAADSCKGAIATDFGTPREVAGGDGFNDINKCRLRPLQRTDYQVTFTDAQWSRLQQAFPSGVCEWSKPGVGQQPTVPWLTYQTAKGRVVYGGRRMSRAPRSRVVSR